MEYVSTKDGYRMEYPKTWKVSDKKGANIIYEDPALKYNTVAVLVYPVRIKSLEQFGTLEFAASKLLAVENSKVRDLCLFVPCNETACSISEL